MPSRRAQNPLTLLFAAFAVMTAPALRGDALDGVLEVRSAYVSVEQSALHLFARVAYPVNDDIRAALKDGLTLTFDLDAVVTRERRFWMDETVWEYQLKRELSYHAVSDRYLTREVDAQTAGEQHSYASLEEAPQLETNRQYRVALRAGVRRGRLSDTMRVLLFWTDDWHRESEWFSWSLQR